MEAGINSDQNFYSRSPSSQPPVASNDIVDSSPLHYDSNPRQHHPHSYLDSRPVAVPPKVSLVTSNLQTAAVNGYGDGAAGGSDSPAPDDFYRGFSTFQSSDNSNEYTVFDTITNGMTVPTATSSTNVADPRQPTSSLRSNGNGTTPKHPTIPTSRHGMKFSVRSASAPLDQRMASLNTAKSTPALNNGYSRSQQKPTVNVRELSKRYDSTPAVAPKPLFRPSVRENSIGAGGYTRRTTSENQYATSETTAGVTTGEASLGRTKSPAIPRPRRTKFVGEDELSNNTLSGVARAGRAQQTVTENTQPSKLMVNVSPAVPPNSAIPVPTRRPLFGEVIAADAVSTSIGYGIDARARRTSESSIHQALWSRKEQTEDVVPTSPSAWYRGVTPALLDDVDSKKIPRSSRKHNRSRSDFAGSSSTTASLSRDIFRAPTQSRLPVSSKQLATQSETSSTPSTRSTSPHTARTPTPSDTKIRKSDPRPWSPAGRAVTPTHRSPGRPNPGKIVTNSSLKAYISAPPPKTSPPLRSSRPRQPVSAATTASSRGKTTERTSPGQQRSGPRTIRIKRLDSQSNSRVREPSPSNEQLKAAAARATKAISKNILESEQREMREAEKRRQIMDKSDSKLEECEPSMDLANSRSVSSLVSSPKLVLKTASLAPSPMAEITSQHTNALDPDSPTLGMPGSFPGGTGSADEDVPQSAISAATGVTEFDNEPQTEPPRLGGGDHSYKVLPPFDAGDYSRSEAGLENSVFPKARNNGSIKIILDTSSIDTTGDTKLTTNHVSEKPEAEIQRQPGEITSTSTMALVHDEQANLSYVTTSQTQGATLPHANPTTEVPYLDDVQFYQIDSSRPHHAPLEEGAKSTQWDAQAFNSLPPLSLPHLSPGLDTSVGGTNSRPDFLETPVTEIDYESSEGGENNAAASNNSDDYKPLSLSISPLRHSRSSQHSTWTDCTIETDDYRWGDELAMNAPPLPHPSLQNHPPLPPPKEKEDYSRPEVPPKPPNYSPMPSPRATGDTSPIPNSAIGRYQYSSIPSVPAWPNHSPPPPPPSLPRFSNGDGSTSQSSRTPPLSSSRFPPTSMHRPIRDSGSRRESVDDLHSSRQSLSTPRSSTQISEGDTVPNQPLDELKATVAVSENNEAAEKQIRRLQHRGRVIKELIDTEAVYLKDMNVVEEIYKGTAEACPKLEPNDIKIIFRNTEQIVAFSTMFLDELKAASASVYSARSQRRRQSRSATATSSLMSPAPEDKELSSNVPTEESDFDRDQKTSIGAYFGRHLQEMQNVYTEFLRSSEKANSRLGELQHDGAVKVWLGECNLVAKDLTAAWDLDALLIKPVQRITRYQLLLSSLLENTPEEHPDYRPLKITYREVGDLLKNIDELKKRIDTVGRIVGGTRKRKESDVRTGLAKAFGRRDKAFSTSSNRPGEDEVYAKLHEKWNHDFFQLQIILRDAEQYNEEVRCWVHNFLQYLSAMELVMRVTPSSFPELESKWARFNMSMRDMGTIALEDHQSAVRKQIIEPLEQVIKAYGPPELAMKKRAKRRIDYEKSLSLKAANKKIDEKLADLVDQYTALNETLKFELPKLSGLTEKLGNMCLVRLISIQTEWYGIWKEKVKTVLEESEMPKDPADIIDKFNRDFKYQLKLAGDLSIINGSFLTNAYKGRLSHSTTATREDEQRYSPRPSSTSNSSRNAPLTLSNRARGLSINSEHSPSLPTPDFARRLSGQFTFSPVVTESPGLPHFSTRDFPPTNTHSRAGSGSPTVGDIFRPAPSRPATGRSEAGNIPPRNVDSANATRSPSTSVSYHQFEAPLPHSRPFSGLFHSAMPPADGPDDSQRSSRVSSHDRERYGGYNVLYLAASLFEFDISATKSEAGYPYLTYQAGEIFDVIGEKGELWLAKNQDDPVNTVGWIWSKHFARLAN